MSGFRGLKQANQDKTAILHHGKKVFRRTFVHKIAKSNVHIKLKFYKSSFMWTYPAMHYTMQNCSIIYISQIVPVLYLRGWGLWVTEVQSEWLSAHWPHLQELQGQN